MPVNFHLVDRKPMAFTEAAWRMSFVGGAPVTVRHQGRVHQAEATLVRVTPEEMADAVLQSLSTGGSAQRMGLTIPRGHHASVPDLAALGPALGTAVITFDVVQP